MRATPFLLFSRSLWITYKDFFFDYVVLFEMFPCQFPFSTDRTLPLQQ